MALFGNMPWFCNCCGKEMSTSCHGAMGRSWRVCSLECVREMGWRETLSILGKEYYPKPPESESSEPCR